MPNRFNPGSLALEQFYSAAAINKRFEDKFRGGRVTAFSAPTPTRSTTPRTQTTGGINNLISAIGSGRVTGGSTSASSSTRLPVVAPDTTSRNVNAARTAARSSADIALDVAKRLQPFVTQQFRQNLEQAFPGYRDVFAQQTANVGASLRGELPEDVANMIRMFSAEQNRQGALAGTARNLGLASLERSDVGFSQAGQLFDIASTHLTPPQLDVFSVAENVRRDVSGASMISPAEAGSLALQKESLDLQKRQQSIDQMQFGAKQTLAQRELDQDLFKHQSELNWQKELSSINMAFTQQVMNEERELLRRSEAARAAEDEAERATRNKFSGILSTMLAGGPIEPARLT